jgi:hypothetical protein
MGLGSFLTVTLAEARLKAADARKLRASGIDPIEARRAQHAAALVKAAKALTFRNASASYIAAHRAGWRNAEHAHQWEATLIIIRVSGAGRLAGGRHRYCFGASCA